MSNSFKFEVPGISRGTKFSESEVKKMNTYIRGVMGLGFPGATTVLMCVLGTILGRLSKEDRSNYLLAINSNVMFMARRSDVSRDSRGEYSMDDKE